MSDKDIMNEKLFSLNDLLSAGLITMRDLESWLRYKEAEVLVKDMFKGKF